MLNNSPLLTDYLVYLWTGAILFFIGTFVLTSFSSTLRRFQKKNLTQELPIVGKLFFYRPLHLFFFPENEYEGLVFSTISALNAYRILFALCLSSIALIHHDWFIANPWLGMLLVFLGLFALFILTDFVPRVMGSLYPKSCFKNLAPFISFFLVLTFPFTFILMKLCLGLFKSTTFDYLHEPMAEAKQEIYDMIQENVEDVNLDQHDKKILQAVFNFRELIAREIMVPRVDLFSLPSDISIRDSAAKLEQEGYSRIPVYKGTIDHVLGVLMYKDVLVKFREASEKNDSKILDQPIESIIKPVIYTPETKKISQLLQEFRKRQLHLAIVVDEYGGTEGIVTIEDILEEIVGDIEDEYDDEEDLLIALADGSYIVDARMNLLDLEEQLNITLPDAGDYDTIGGYIFHKAGEIPTRGFIIKQDNITIEVLRAGERNVEKVRIKIQ